MKKNTQGNSPDKRPIRKTYRKCVSERSKSVARSTPQRRKTIHRKSTTKIQKSSKVVNSNPAISSKTKPEGTAKRSTRSMLQLAVGLLVFSAIFPVSSLLPKSGRVSVQQNTLQPELAASLPEIEDRIVYDPPDFNETKERFFSLGYTERPWSLPEGIEEAALLERGGAKLFIFPINGQIQWDVWSASENGGIPLTNSELINSARDPGSIIAVLPGGYHDTVERAYGLHAAKGNVLRGIFENRGTIALVQHENKNGPLNIAYGYPIAAPNGLFDFSIDRHHEKVAARNLQVETAIQAGPFGTNPGTGEGWSINQAAQDEGLSVRNYDPTNRGVLGYIGSRNLMFILVAKNATLNDIGSSAMELKTVADDDRFGFIGLDGGTSTGVTIRDGGAIKDLQVPGRKNFSYNVLRVKQEDSL